VFYFFEESFSDIALRNCVLKRYGILKKYFFLTRPCIFCLREKERKQMQEMDTELSGRYAETKVSFC
jgi:hypothetical protein